MPFFNGAPQMDLQLNGKMAARAATHERYFNR
jgi:hypothetical protein